MDLDRVIEFNQLLLQFQSVERALKVPGQDRFENDTEHSYNLAMTGWYVAASQKLNLDLNLVIKYGLIHDLVEAYAGDTAALGGPNTHRQTKQAREQLAMMLLRRHFPDFQDLNDLLETYENRRDDESQFIYALDKLMANLTVYLNDGADWQRMGTNLEEALKYNHDRVQTSPPVAELSRQLHERIRERGQFGGAPSQDTSI